MQYNAELILARKMSYIKRAIQDSINNPEFVGIIRGRFLGVDRRDYIDKLWRWQDKFEFVPEQYGDYVKDAMEFIRSGCGDCEDFVVFNSAALKLLGVPVRIVAADTRGKGYYTHVFVEVYSDGRWVPFDGTYRMKGFGCVPKIYGGRIRKFMV